MASKVKNYSGVYSMLNKTTAKYFSHTPMMWVGRFADELAEGYEKYKDYGFTIVGVARESSRDNMRRAVAQDGYPWLNLLELHGKNKIWNKYGVEGSGGITVLVDRDGTILAVAPTAEEVEQILQEKLSLE